MRRFVAMLLILLCAGLAAEPTFTVENAVRVDYCSQPKDDASVEMPATDDRAIQLLVETGNEISNNSDSAKACKSAFRKGDKLYERALKRNFKAAKRAAGYEASDDDAIKAIQSELNRLWIADQAARQTYIEFNRENVNGAALWAKARATANTVAVDTEALRYMRQLLSDIDWIDRQRFGNRPSRQAWLLIQHADSDPALQALALQRMETYLESGGVRKRDYAYLWDRVAVNNDRLQRYGTQPNWQCENGQLSLQPVEFPETVDERRAEMGLGSAEEGLAEMSASVCGG